MDKDFLKNLAVKWQTLYINVLREYLQHLFLSSLYKKNVDKVFFKGGTALRLVFNSPRFSEDLDFSSLLSEREIEKLIESVLIDLNNFNIKIDILTAKKTSGGYFCNSKCVFDKEEIGLKLNFSNRRSAKGEVFMISSDLIVPYSVFCLQKKDLIKEKIEALLNRKKDRDFFDLYFILRSRIEVDEVIKKRKELIDVVKNIDSSFDKLKVFLPKSFGMIAKRMKSVLLNELEGV